MNARHNEPMTRKQRQTVIEAFKLLSIAAEEGTTRARALSIQDLGPVASARTIEIMALHALAEQIAKDAATLATGIGHHIGATAILDRAKYPRAKTLSSSRPPPRHK